MKPSIKSAIGAVFAAVLLAAGIPVLSPAAETEISAAPAFTAEQLARHPRTGWFTNGGNIYNQRYSPLAQINRDNIDQVKAEWRVDLGGSGEGPAFSGQGQTLAYDGVLYVVTGANDVFAISVEEGEILWKYTADIDPDRVVACCGRVSRGLSLGDGKVYLGRIDAKLVALDQKTGDVVWSIQAESPEENFSITSAPLYYDGMVITGFAGGDFGIRGRVKAYDADTGELIWTFYTIPGPGQLGHDTWPQDNDAWKHGGGAVWQTPAVDPELGLLYFAPGNPGPDFNGRFRAGDNLFTDSIVAVDVETGEYRWHFQQIHHDIWDYDPANPVVLFDAEVDGEMRKGIAEVNKAGYLYILDRATGEPLIGIEEVPVPQAPAQATAPTQPIPVGDDIVPHSMDATPEGHLLVNQGRTFTPFNDEPVVVQPLAAISWPPSSYDPETHLMYICGGDAAGTMGAADVDIGADTGESYMAGNFSRVGPRRGIFAAVDLTTNRLAWRQEWVDDCRSGSVVTAGGLVFVGRNDGRLTALDKSNGLKLWEFQTDAGVNTPVTVFEHDGIQYIAVLAAGTLYADAEKGDGVWLFSLEGTLDSLPETANAPTSPGTVTVADGSPDLAQGKEIYIGTCAPCHGTTGQGGHGGGAPLTKTLTPQTIAAVVTGGRNDMPAFADMFSPAELRDISAYILEHVAE